MTVEPNASDAAKETSTLSWQKKVLAVLQVGAVQTTSAQTYA